MIIRIENHPTERDYLLAFTPPEMAHTMGRFGAANRSKKLNAYVVRAEHLDQLRTFARHEGASVLDERDAPDVKKYSGPLPECRSCGAPASRKASMALNGCTKCGDVWHPVAYEAPGSVNTRVECRVCGHRQGIGGRFCGNCRAAMPPWPPPGDVDAHVALARKAAGGRDVLQDPLPVGQAIAELELDHHEEEPQRERYP